MKRNSVIEISRQGGMEQKSDWNWNSIVAVIYDYLQFTTDGLSRRTCLSFSIFHFFSTSLCESLLINIWVMEANLIDSCSLVRSFTSKASPSPSFSLLPHVKSHYRILLMRMRQSHRKFSLSSVCEKSQDLIVVSASHSSDSR
jgi:hypothetical protein